MTPTALIAAIHADLNGRVSKRDLQRILASLSTRIAKNLAQGAPCVVSGLGRVTLATRQARSGVVNVGAAKGTRFRRPALVVPRMAFGKTLREAAARNNPTQPSS